MQALDWNIERRIRDSLDLSHNYFFSRELTMGDLRYFRQKDSQGVSVASNYFAMACPIMPLAFLGAFFMLGKMDDSYQGPYERQLAEYHRAEQTQALYMASLKQKLESEGRSCSGQILEGKLRALEGKLAGARDLPEKAPEKKRKENALMMEGKGSQRLSGPMLLSKSQTEVGKLIRAKSALEGQADKLNHSQDYHSVARVSSRIEMIDKALKRLGC
jgi:hypothetical protein